MKNIDSIGHVTGRSIYLDDIPVREGTLYGLVFDATIAHGTIENVDYTAANELDGVECILTHHDIPGENQIGGILPDEQLLSDGEIHFWGQPIAVIIAQSMDIAREAKKLIKISYNKKEVITDPREAAAKGQFIMPSRTFSIGNISEVWEKCKYVYEGKADSNGQEHLYLETQGSYAIPMESGNIKLYSSTQGPTVVQRSVARVLGVGMHKIEVDVMRLGGGFGGKEDQATPWAVMAALGVEVLKKPIKIVLDRMDDMRMTGKRHPYSSDYKIGLSVDLKILAYEVSYFQNAGAAADLSPAIMERTLFHATNSYFIPHVEATAHSCKTNLPPNTAFRGFGGPQGMFVIESALAHAAREIGVDRRVLQEKNILKDGNIFPYGQIAEGVGLGQCFTDMKTKFELDSIIEAQEIFNQNNSRYKKGYSLMPITFGISFTKTPMNQARALVHVYSDGSVGISTGAVEMGQGVNTKMLQIAAEIFDLSPERIKIETTNTTRVSNTSPSAASATADLNGKALENACNPILQRLLKCAATHLEVEGTEVSLKNGYVYVKRIQSKMSWEELIDLAFLDRVCLTENGHYATPTIHFDKSIEKGHPFAYHVFGLALTEVTLDCLLGSYEFDAVKIVHDFGKSMNMDIDMGQIEGGLVQGIGWMTMEDLQYNKEGRLLSNALSTYKIPDIYAVPKQILVEALDATGAPLAIKKSKAVGEPPLMYGIGAYFAIENAISHFNGKRELKYDAPYTHEKVLMALYDPIS